MGPLFRAYVEKRAPKIVLFSCFGPPFLGRNECCLCQVCCRCLWCCVCVCGESVGGAVECQLLVYDEFSAVSLRGTMLSAMSVLLEKKSLWRHGRPQARGPKLCPFFPNIQRLLAHDLRNMGSKSARNSSGLAGVGCWASCVLSSFHKGEKQICGERRLELDCAVQHCLVVFTVQQQQKLTFMLHESCTIGHKVLVHHFDPLLTFDFQARPPRSATSVQCQERP